MLWIYSFTHEFNLPCSKEVRFFLAFISAINRNSLRKRPERKKCYQEKPRRFTTSFRFTPNHLTGPTRIFIAQHVHIHTWGTEPACDGIRMSFICNTHVFEFILDVFTPGVSGSFPRKIFGKEPSGSYPNFFWDKLLYF